jgi:hypothetical protein
MSIHQSEAQSYINKQLAKGGELYTPAKRTPKRIRNALDKAFGTDMAATEKKAHKASSTVVGKDLSGNIKLSEVLNASSKRG